MMKKTFAAFAALALILVPLSASAASFHSGKDYLLGKDEGVSGDLYAAANYVAIEGMVVGDVTGAGSTFSFTGSASQDLQVAGGTLTLIGNVGDDVRAAGGTITYGSSAKGDVLLAGGNVTISSSALVGGDAVVVAGRAVIRGSVQGSLRVRAREVTIDATILGPISISAEKVIIGSHAVLSGPLTYRSSSEAEILAGAVMKGEVVYEPVLPRESTASPIFWAKVIGIWFVLKILMLFLGSILVALYYRRAVKGIAQRMYEGFGWNVLLGFAFLVATPLAAVFLMMTVVGLLFGVLVLLVYAAMLIIATLYIPAVVGGEIYRYFKKEEEMKVSITTIVIGTVVLALLALIPVIGWIAAFVLMLGALGASIRFKWSELQSYR